MNDLSIIYYTDNSLDDFLFKKCQEHLIRVADGRNIVSVSQKPIDLGLNLCIGEIGRSHHSLYLQALTGAKLVNTEYIALAEHDCLYPAEHFRFVPPTDNTFYYNINCWIAQWGGSDSGMYSYLKRKTLSNLICNRELFIEAITERLQILNNNKIRKGQLGACEPGGCDTQLAFEKLIDCEYSEYHSESFRTKNPTLDIRHGSNFSGGRKAKNRCFSIPYWKDLYSVMGVVPPGRWYQEAVINGTPVPIRRERDTSEKRWKKFIGPHIKLESGTVTDLGCNAGFYSRKLTDLGFKVTGVELNPEFLRHAYYWERQDPKGVKFIESDINNYTPECSHYVLLANVHYWIEPKKLDVLVNKLRENALNVILIGRYRPYKGHKSPCDLAFLEQLFDGWVKGDVIRGGKHFSVIFRNPDLAATDIDDFVLNKQEYKQEYLLPTYGKLVDDVLAGEEIEPKATGYYGYLLRRRDQNRRNTFKRHADMILNIMDHGIDEPLTVKNGILIDGDHRLIVAKKLGHKSLICKINHEK